MKHLKKSFFVALALGLMLFGCKPDNVDPTGKNGGSGDKSIAGAFDDLHPTLDTVCKISDSIFFRSADGSFFVNKCVSEDWFNPVVEPCAPGQPKWGSYFVYNGYQYTTTDTIHWLDVDFTLAPGVFNDLSSWKFTTSNGISIDPNTGNPNVGTDWSTLVSNPVRNQWKVQIRVDQLPQPSFDLACKMSVVRLSFFGDEIPGTRTDLWAVNQFWNQAGSEYASNNEYALRYAPLGCLPSTGGCAPAQASSVCEVVYKGVTCPGNTLGTTTLTPSVTGLTAPTYAWSNGATTASLTVSPTVTTSYTVSITEGACVSRIVTFDVNVIDASCVIAPPVDLRADFCPTTVDVRFNQSFNIRDYVKMRNGSNVNWSNVRFTYTTNGANSPTNPANWKLTNFNNGQSVTALSTDAGQGRGNVARGEYKIYVYRVGQATYDDFMTIRVSNSRPSTVLSAKCSNGNGGGNCGNGGSGSGSGSGNGSGNGGSGSGNGGSGSGNGGSGSGNGGSGSGNGGNGGNGGNSGPGVKVCHVPPGNPGAATTICVPLAQLSQHVTGVCGANNGGGNGGNGGSGSGSGNGGSGSGSGNGGSNGSSPNCGPNHQNGNHSGCSHNNSHPANCGNNHHNGNHSGCSHGNGGNGGSGSGSGSGGHCSHGGGRTGCGNGNPSGGHSLDRIGACGDDPCNAGAPN